MKVSHALAPSATRGPKLIFRFRTRWRAPSSAELLCSGISGWASTISRLAFLARVRATPLDQDATLVETHQRDALYCYQGFKAYQPLTTYWAEPDLVVHSEFRDGNVPAGYEQLRGLQEALELLPAGVEQVRLRSDTAGYQQELLKYCTEGKHPKYGVIEFAVGVDVTQEFKKAALEVAEAEWHPLRGKPGKPQQEWAEVCYLPSWVGRSKNGPDYRFLAMRELLSPQLELPGMAGQQSLPFPTPEMPQQGHYKLFGLVTNRDLPGEEVSSGSASAAVRVKRPIV